MRPKSNTLFHFTKSPQTLKHVLRDGFWPRYCLEDVGWLGYSKFEYIAYPMVCFCEIPLSRIAEHVDFYGEFGLGLTREWAETQGLNPVFYTARSSQIAKAFREVSNNASFLTDGDKQAAAYSTARYLLAHAKPTSGKMLLNGEPVDKVFYQESEWRYVPRSPKFTDYLGQSSFEDPGKIEAANQLTKMHAMLQFSPRDIRYVFVKEDSDIPDMVDFIYTQMRHLIASDQQMLMSRVVSLESLRDDL
jgi:hypothetical protein